jgi:hypothetical protein
MLPEIGAGFSDKTIGKRIGLRHGVSRQILRDE